MKMYGYTRVSTQKQNIDRQIRNIKAEYPTAIILQDEYTGTKMSRPAWDKLTKAIKEGDIIIFDSVSRMSRNADEGYCMYEELYNKGIELVFLKEPQINTQTYKGALMNAVPLTNTAVDAIIKGVNEYLLILAKEQIRLAFIQAEKEVNDLHQRTREGIETARMNGKQIGQKKGTKLVTKKSVIAKAIMRTHLKDYGGTLSNTECQKLMGVSRNSFYKYKAEISREG